MIRCLDCQTPVNTPFCPECGQKVGPPRRLFRSLLAEFFSESFALDGRFLRTLRPLLLRPGILTREYNAGRRTRYMTPIRLYLLATFLLFFGFTVRSWIVAFSVQSDIDTVATEVRETIPPSVEISGLEDLPVERPFFRRMVERFESANEDRENWDSLIASWLGVLPTTLFFLLPVFGFLCWIVTVGRGLYFAETFVFALHTYSFTYLFLLVKETVPEFTGHGFLLAFIPLYFVIALARAFELRWYSAILRSLVLAVLFAPICLMAGLVALAFATGMS